MKRLLFFVLILLSANSYSSTFVRGKIIYKDGHSREGQVGLLSSTINEGIPFKKSENSSETIDVEKIQSIIYYIGEEEHVFEYVKDFKLGAEPVEKNLRRPTWQYVVVQGNVTLYLDGISDMRVENDQLIITHSYTQYYRVMKRDDLGAVTIAMNNPATDKLDAISKKTISRYFSDYPELTARLNSDEFGWKDIPSFVSLYNQWKIENLVAGE